MKLPTIHSQLLKSDVSNEMNIYSWQAKYSVVGVAFFGPGGCLLMGLREKFEALSWRFSNYVISITVLVLGPGLLFSGFFIFCASICVFRLEKNEN